MAIPSAQSDWVYGIGDGPMTNYTDDDNGNPTSLVKFVTKSQQAAEYQLMTLDNDGSSTGTDFATEQWNDRHDVNISFDIDPSINMTRRLLKAGMGLPVTSSPNAGVSKDVFSPQDAADRQLPVFWMGERCGTKHDAIYPSCMLEKITFAGEETGRLNAKGNFRGSGKQILGAAVPINAETNKYYLKNTGSKIVRAAAATPGVPVETIQCGLQSWMLDIDNAPNQNVGYDPGCARYFTPGDEDSGIIRSYHPFGKRKYTGQFNIWLPNSSPNLTLLRNQTPLALRMGMFGKTIASTYKNAIEFIMHLAVYRAISIGQKDGFNLMQITPNALYNETLNKILSVEITYPTPV